MNTGLDALADSLHARCQAITVEWQRAIAPTGFVPLADSQVHQQLIELTRQVITALLAEPFDPAPVHDVGKALAQLYYVQPETLQKTQAVLSAQLMQGVPDDQAMMLYPRLIALLGELTAGFVERVRETLLDEQEQIRRALMVERQQADEEIRELNKTLIRRVMERTEQLESANQDLEHEVSARMRILETLQDTTQALQTLIQASPLAIVVTDLAGNIKMWNPAAEHMFGWTATEVIGLPLPYVPQDKQAEFESMRVRAGQGEGFSNVEVQRLKKDGTPIDVSVSSAGLHDLHGELSGYVAIIADITARKQSEATLRQYAAELQARNEELDAFAHTVAHDLKNPLGNLAGYAEALKFDFDVQTPEERLACVTAILQGTYKISNIIDELLLLAGVRRAQVKLVPLDMASIVHEACKRVSYMIDKACATIELPDESAWPNAVGYAPWIEEVWVNYISNALKYGTPPGAAPHIELGGEAGADDMARFWVRDHGPGITPVQQARLFTPFTQLSQVRAKGYGLGLSIVHRIVERLGGQVGVESNGVPGEGSLFYFTLPTRSLPQRH